MKGWRLWIYIFGVLGIVGYYFMYWTDLPKDTKWDIYFPIDKAMDMVVIIALWIAISPRFWDDRLLLLALTLTKAFDLLSELDKNYQQGNYIEYMAHAFGIVCCIIIALLINDYKGKIKSWFKSPPNS